MQMRSFRLMLDPETFDKWKRYYPNFGTRQTIMRQVVRLMIRIAEQNTPDVETIFNTEVRLILGRYEGKEV